MSGISFEAVSYFKIQSILKRKTRRVKPNIYRHSKSTF